MPYATGETPQLRDTVETQDGKRFEVKVIVSVSGEQFIGPNGNIPTIDAATARLIHRRFDITKLDTSGVFDEAKPLRKLYSFDFQSPSPEPEQVYYKHHSIGADEAKPASEPYNHEREMGWRYAQELDRAAEILKRVHPMGAVMGIGRLQVVKALEELHPTTDHHAPAAPLPADGPQVKDAAATEAKDGDGVKPTEAMRKAAAEISCDADGLWCQDIETIIARHVSPELAAARDEIEKLAKERDQYKHALSAESELLNECRDELAKVRKILDPYSVHSDRRVSDLADKTFKCVNDFANRLSAARAALGAV